MGLVTRNGRHQLMSWKRLFKSAVGMMNQWFWGSDWDGLFCP